MGRILLYCQPGARQTQYVGEYDGMPKVQLQAPPVDGAANAALIEWIAERLHRPRSAVRITLGTKHRIKRIEVDGFDDAQLRRLLVARAEGPGAAYSDTDCPA